MKKIHYLTVVSSLIHAMSQPAPATPNDGRRLSFGTIAPATSVAESKARLEDRRNVVLKYWRDEPIGLWGKERSADYYLPIAARLHFSHNVEEANTTLSDPRNKVYAKVGSDFNIFGAFCRRAGDYDFMLQGITNITARHASDPARLYLSTLDHLLSTLLNQKGAKHHIYSRYGLCGIHKETENHILMTETSRYITNQMMPPGNDAKYDNKRNGFNIWMVEHLRRFLQEDFKEYNAKPYQGYTIAALENLLSHAVDPHVKTATQGVLDYLSARFAIQNNGLRRSTPFKRQPRYRDEDRLWQADSETARFALLAGNYAFYGSLKEPWSMPYGEHFAGIAALSTYKIPDLILDLMIEKDHHNYFQRHHHEGVEIYHSSPSYLISAGGIFVNELDWGTGELDGWAVPTTLMPTRSTSADRSTYIRIDGHRKDRLRNNTCLARNFACGLAPVIPDNISTSCREIHGRWTFIDLAKEECPQQYGFYVAVYSALCDSPRCLDGANTFGFFETAEATTLPFNEFRAKVLAQNGGRAYHAEKNNTYATVDGTTIIFRPLERSKYHWGIKSIDGQAQETNIKRWPLAKGDIMDADGTGLVLIKNPYLDQHIVIDLRNPKKPSYKITPPVKR